MSDDYTPSTEEVREVYWECSGESRRGAKSWGEFDRWLAEHDRQVSERAWADGVHFANNSADTFCACEGNPYRKETT